MNEEDEQIRNLYRQVIRDGIDWDELHREKNEFIRAHFEPPRHFLFRPAFTVPALSFCVALAFCVALFPRKVHQPDHAIVSQEPLTAMTAAPAVQQAPVPASAGSRAPESPAVPEDIAVLTVSVDQLESDVGIPMVYQKIVNDVPMVVIWVFPKTPVASA